MYAILVAIAAANLMAVGRRFFRVGCRAIVSCAAVTSSSLVYSLISGIAGGLWYVEDPTDSAFAEPMKDGTFAMLPRYIRSSQSPNQLAFYRVSALFFVMSAAMAGQRTMSHAWRWPLLAVILATVLATQSGAAILAIVTGMALLLFKRMFRTWTATTVLTAFSCLHVDADRRESLGMEVGGRRRRWSAPAVDRSCAWHRGRARLRFRIRRPSQRSEYVVGVPLHPSGFHSERRPIRRGFSPDDVAVSQPEMLSPQATILFCTNDAGHLCLQSQIPFLQTSHLLVHVAATARPRRLVSVRRGPGLPHAC